jgi:hypothetical protein
VSVFDDDCDAGAKQLLLALETVGMYSGVPMTGRRSRFELGAVVVATLAYLVARTVEFPGTPILLGGDQGFFWMYAERLLKGELPYRDFFQFTPPGTDVVYFAAFALFGARIWVTNAVVVVLGTALAGVCYCLARGLMSKASAALATAIWIVLVVGQALSGTHHAWSALAVMGAVVAVSRGDGPPSCGRFAIGGAFLGLASFFTQTQGLAGLVAFSVFAAGRAACGRASRRDAALSVAALWSGFAVTLASGIAYFILKVGAGPVWSCLVAYVAKYMAPAWIGPSYGLPASPSARNLRWLFPYLLLYLVVPLGYVLATRRLWLERSRPEGRSVRRLERLVLVGLVGVALLAMVATNLSWVRLFYVSMPAIVVLVWSIDRPSTATRIGRFVAWCTIGGLAVFFVRSSQRHHHLVFELPAGVAAIEGTEQGKLDWLARHTAPGDALFAADRPDLYLLFRTHSPAFLDAVVPTKQTSMELASRVISDLETSRVEYVLWTPELEAARIETGLAPVAAIGTYLHAHYHRVARFGDGDEAWARD